MGRNLQLSARERLELAHRVGRWRAQQGSGSTIGARPDATPRAESCRDCSGNRHLADLQQKGILSPEEFAAKKAELRRHIPNSIATVHCAMVVAIARMLPRPVAAT